MLQLYQLWKVSSWSEEGSGEPEDDPLSGRPATATTHKNIDRIHHMVMANRRLTVHQIVYDVAISRERVENILHNELGTSKVSALWVPQVWTPDQKHTRLVMSQANLALFEADPATFLERFLTKMSIGSTTSNQWPNCNPWSGNTTLLPLHRRPGRQGIVKGREGDGLRLLGCKGHCVIDYLQKDQNINGENNANYGNKKTAWKLTKGFLFHQDNAPAHKSVVAMAVVRDCGFKLVDHPPYSRDLTAPSDYFLFPNIYSRIRIRASIPRNPSAPMEKVCGPQGRLCWKINYIILVKFNHCIIVSLWTIQPTLVRVTIMNY